MIKRKRLPIFKTLFTTLVVVGIFGGCSDKNKDFHAMGVFESDEILVSSEIGGKIVSLDVREGDILTMGAQVGQIDVVELKLNKDKLLKQIASAISKKIDLTKQTAPIMQQIKTAQKEQERTARLLKAHAATTKNLDDIEAQILFLQKQLTAQTSSITLTNQSIDDEVESIRFQIAVIDDKISKASISSPINGTVLEKYAYTGEICSIGKPIFKIADTDVLRLKAYIVEPQLTQAKLGDKVKVYADFGGNRREYEGTITWVSAKAEFTPKTIMTKDERENLVYAIKVDVKNDGYLKIGSYGELKFNLVGGDK